MAARTRTADNILGSKELLALYESFGGLESDLVEIRDEGLRAEALNGSQSGAMAAGGTATADVHVSFAAVQREYSGIMAAVQASIRDARRAGVEAGVIDALVQIHRNETAISLRSVDAGAAPDGAAKKKKVAARKLTQEALRAEIQKDAAGLVDLKGAHPALAKRKVDLKRLKKLQADSLALAGKLAERAAVKGAGKGATAAERDAVSAQREVWGATYRILAAVGRADVRVAALLKEAARK